MSKAKKITGIAALALAMTAGFAAIASPPPRPASFFGTISTDGFEIPAETRVTAWAGSRILAETTVFPTDGQTAYSIDIPGDIPETPAVEGAVAGQAITLRIGGAAAPQPAAWEAGTYNRLDLTVPAGPDITATISDGVTSVFPGGDLTYTLTVRNNGPGTAKGIVLQDLLPQHATATSLGGGTVADGIVSWPPFDLEAGASTTRTMTLEVATELPVGTTEITNQARAAHDGSSGLDPQPLDNLGSDTNAVLVPPDFALSADELTVSPAQPQTGELVTVQLTVRNPGYRDGTALVAVYAGAPFATPAVASQTVTLPAQGSATRTFQFTASGPLTLVSAAADPANQVVELDESNNVARRFLVEVPDLAIGLDNILATPAAPRAGDAVQVKVTVRNAGRKLAENVDVTLYDGEPGLGGVAVGTGRITALPAGGNRAVSFNWTAAEGQRKLTAVADPANAFLEMSEENNSAVREVVIPRAAGPDLTVQSVDAAGLVQSATTLVADGAVSAILKNVGDAAVASDFAVRLFEDRDGDGLFSRGDRELARQTVSGGLAAGAATTVQLSLRAHLEFHHPLLWVEADAAEAIVELREDNNRTACFGVCETPAAASLTPVEEEWFLPGMEVETAPVVVQLSDDNGDGKIDSRDIPEVVFHTEDGAGFAVTARSGVDGSETWTFRASEQYRLGNRLVHLTAADLDGDGVAEILAGLQDQRLVALDHFGQPMWTSDPVPLITRSWAGAPSVADLTGDGVPEIVIGHTVLSNTGKLLGTGTANVGQNYNWYGPLGVPTTSGVDAQLSVVADIDLDGRAEIVAGDAVYRMEGGQLRLVWDNIVPENFMRDGFSAVANLDGDPEAEIVYTSSGFAMVLNHDKSVAVGYRRIYPLSPFPDLNTFWGGPPTIANLDGEGPPEILFAGDRELRAYRSDLRTLYWSRPIDERGSQTAATVFDLDADGKPEVLYLDQSNFYILNGQNGEVRYSRPNTSKTALEYPVVADVDNDGQAEILVPSNRSFLGDVSTQGLHVLGSPGWGGTRPIWNQHSYHVTNVLLDGTVPAAETPSWLAENTYRVNEKLERRPSLLPNATLGAPRVGEVTSSGAPVKLRVGNGGRGVLPAGVPVVLYAGHGVDPASGVVAGQGVTSKALRPGAWEDLTVFWQRPGLPGAPATAVLDPNGSVGECDDTDNAVEFEITESVLPDLMLPEDALVLPASRVAGQKLSIGVRVTNAGTATSPVSLVRLYDGPPSLGAERGAAEIPALAPGQSATVQVVVDSLGLAGTVALHAVADAEDVVLESDEGNNERAASIDLTAPTQPDLSLETLRIEPPSTTVGTPVHLRAEVVNRGLTLSGSFQVVFRVNRVEVARITADGPFAAAGRRTFEHVLDTVELRGLQQIEAEADPGRQISEVTDGNNLRSGVLEVGSSGLTVSIQTERVSYTSNDTATLTVRAENGSSAPRDVTLRILIRSAAGTVQVPIADEPVSLLPGTTTLIRSWSTGAAAAGTWSAVAELVQADGTVVARGSSLFSIVGDRKVAAQLLVERDSYEPTEEVALAGRIRNAGTNQALSDLQARLTVTAPSGAAVFSNVQAIGRLEPGEETSFDASWPIANAAPGVYTARLEVRDGGGSGSLLAFSSSALTVFDSSQTGAGLSGEMTVSPDPVGSGGLLLSAFTTANGGNADMTGLHLRVRLVRLSDEAVAAVRELPWPLARNQQRSGAFGFATAGFAEGDYVALLEGLLPGGDRVLTRVPFQVVRGVSVQDATVIEGDAGTAEAVFEIVLSAAAEEPVTVTWATADGTALAGEDYDAASGTVTFAPGEQRRTIAVTVRGDLAPEAPEIFLLSLDAVSGAALADGQALAEIADEEGCASPSLLVNGGAETGETDAELTGWSPVSGASGAWRRRFADPAPLAGTAAFGAAGVAGTGSETELRQDVDLSPFAASIDAAGQQLLFEAFVQSLPADAPDGALLTVEYRDAANATVLGSFDSGEIVSLGLWQAVADARTVPAGTRWARIRIRALPRSGAGVFFDRLALRSLGTPTLTGGDVEVSEGNAGTAAARFEVRLACLRPSPVELDWIAVSGTAAAGQDFEAVSGTVTFEPGQTVGTIEVPVRGDSVDEQDETFGVELSASPDLVLLRSRLTGRIADDDGAVLITAEDGYVDEGDSGFGEARVTVRLSAPSGKTVKVSWTTVSAVATGSAAPGSDFTTASGTLTFAPGVEEQAVTVPVRGDRVDEEDETFQVRLSAPVEATLARAESTVTVLDNDQAELRIGDAAALEGNSGMASLVFPVTLSIPADREVQAAWRTVDATAVAGVDYEAATGTVTFSPGVTAGSVTVRALGNTAEQGDRMFRVVLDTPVVALLADPEAEGTIRDDDGILVSIDGLTVLEGDATRKDVSLTVRATNVGSRTVTVGYTTAAGTAAEGSDFLAASGTLDLSTGSATVVIPLVGDLTEEAFLESFEVRLAQPSTGSLQTGKATVTIQDDDGWVLNQRARYDTSFPGCILLNNETDRLGTAWRKQRIDLSRSFDQTFEVHLGSSDGGADGIAYVLQNNSTSAVGEGGGYLAFEKITPSVAVEIDTYYNSGWDVTAEDHIAVNLNGNVRHQGHPAVPALSSAANVEDGKRHQLRLIWNGTSRTLDVHFDGEERVVYQRDLIADIFAGTASVIEGFTSASGFVTNLQYVCPTVQCSAGGQKLVSIGDARIQEGNSGTLSMVFPLTLSCPSDIPVTVDLRTEDGTAQAGSDFAALNGSVTFQPGETSKDVIVQIFGDATAEADERFRVVLTRADTAALRYAEGVGTILSDELVLTVTAPELMEPFSSSDVAVTFELAWPLSSSLSFDWVTESGTALSGTDFLGRSGTVTFAPGQTRQTVNLYLLSDALREGDETFRLRLSKANHPLVPATIDFKLIDDDCADNLLRNGSAEEPLAGGKIPGWTTVSGEWTVFNGAPQNGNYIFYAGPVPTAELYQDADVSGYATTIDAGLQRFSFEGWVRTYGRETVSDTSRIRIDFLSAARVALGSFDTGDLISRDTWTRVARFLTPPAGTRTIRISLLSTRGTPPNNDGYYDNLSLISIGVPTFSVDDPAAAEGATGSGKLPFMVALRCPVQEPARVDYVTMDGTAQAGSDYQPAFGTLVFQPTETSKKVEVTVLDDTVREADETVFLNLTNPSGAAIAKTRGTGTIREDEPRLLIGDTSISEGHSGRKVVALDVSLSAATTVPVQVGYSTADGTATAGSDYVAKTGTLQISSGQTGTIEVEVIGDTLGETDETFFVRLSDPQFATIEDGEAVVTINDDDLTVSIGDATVLEGNSGTVQAVFPITLSRPSQEQVTVRWRTEDRTATQQADYTAASDQQVILAKGTTSATLAVSVQGDTLSELGETFAVLLSDPVNAAIGDGEGIGTIADDDACPSRNLLRNPGAEEPLAGTEIPGWQEALGTVWTRTTNPKLEGSYSFTPGSVAEAELTQDVDVSAFAGRIDAEIQLFSFEGFLRTANESTSDTGRLRVEFLDAARENVLAVHDSGLLTSPDVWRQVGTLQMAPAGTRWVRIRLSAARGPASSNNDVYFDQLALRTLGIPVLEIGDRTLTEGNAGSAETTLDVTLSCPQPEPVTVRWTTVDGMALQGLDYEPGEGTLTFEPGVTIASMPLVVLGDVKPEGDETFFVQLADASGPVLLRGRGQVTLRDNDRPATLTLTGTVRDFRPSTHPDFEKFFGTIYPDAGIVEFLLGPDRKPVYGNHFNTPTTTGKTWFDQWYRDVAGVNLATQIPIVLESKDPSNPTVYSYSDETFFPIDGQLYGNEGRNHNFHFTYEVHTQFLYQGGEVFTFTGDDDLWAFINGRLAIDLGGVHYQLSRTVNLDEKAAELGLVRGRVYDIDLFFAERRTGGSSFRIDTSLLLGSADPGVIQFGSPAYEVTEDGAYANVTVTRTRGVDGQVSVSYATEDDTALGGADYTATSGAITFRDGDAAPQTIRIPLVDDATVEPTEAFRIVLSQPVGQVELGPVTTAVVSIGDDDRRAPELKVTKEASVPAAVAEDRQPVPGDTIRYVIQITNEGGSRATNVALEDLIPPYTTLVADSVETTQGSIDGSDPARVRVALGEIAAGASAEVRFDVRIAASVPASLETITNQGVVSSLELPAVLTDDPGLGGTADPTDVAITAEPKLIAEKIASLVIDLDQDNKAEPGDTLEYLITVRNRGNADATGVTLADQIPAHTTLVDGSVIVSQGTGGAVAGEVRAGLGEIAGQQEATVRFRVVIANPFPAGVREISNQGEVDAVELDPVRTDDPGVGGPSDPTVTVVAAAPKLEIDKKATLTGGAVSPGDAFLYVITIANRGNTAATNVILADDLPAGLTLVPGTLQISQGSVDTEEPLRLDLGQVAVGSTATVSFQVAIDSAFTGTEVANQATVTADGIDPVRSNDPETDAPGDPTSTPVFITPDITVENLTVAEGAGSGEVQVRLSKAGNREVRVDFATADGTATAGVDYTATTGTLTFAPGETVKTVSVPVLDDLLDELDETLTIALTNAAGGNLITGSATVAIEDNDAAPAFTISDAQVTEGGAVELTVSLSAPSGLPVQIGYATTDGTATSADYTSASGTLSIPAGSTTATFVVQTTTDALFENDEKLFVNLIDPVNATPADAQAEVTITNDDPAPALSITDVTVTEGDSGAVAATLTVSLSAVSALDASATFATTDGTAKAGADYTAATGTITIPAGSTSATITVDVLGDRIDEQTESFRIVLSEPSSAALSDAEGEVTITDDDETRISIDDVRVSEGQSGTTDAVFTVRLSVPSDRTVRVAYATAAGTATEGEDYEAAADTLVFAAGEVEKTVAVRVIGDGILESEEETFTVELSNAENAAIEDGTGAGVIADDETCAANLLVNPTVDATQPGWTVAAGELWQEVDVTAFAARIDAGQQKLAVLVQAAAGAQVTVEYRDASGSVLAANAGEVRTAPAGTRRIRVRLIAADAAEAFESVALQPVRTPVLRIGDVAVTEAGEATLSVALSCPVDREVTVSFATVDGTALAPADYEAATGTLVFAPGETEKTVTVATATDALDEPEETFEVVLSDATEAVAFDARATVQVNDDDEAPSYSIADVTVTEGNAVELTVTLSAPSGKQIDLDYTTSDGTALAGTDYTAASGTVTIPAGSTAVSFPIQTIADALFENDEKLFVNLIDPVNAAPVDTQAEVTITNDDPAPTLSITDVTVTEKTGEPVIAELTVSLSAQSGRATTVSYSTADGTAKAGSDYTADSEPITIAAGATTATIKIEVLGDDVDELDESFQVVLSDPINATLADAEGAVRILDNDEALLTVADVEVTEGDEGVTEAVFTVRLTTPSDREVKVDFTTEAGTATEGPDYQAASGPLTFEAGEVARSVTVRVNGDRLFEASETFELVLANASGAAIQEGRATGTIADDEECPTPNLLANPGAEIGSTQTGVIPGWTADGAAWTRRTGNPAAAEGTAYFAAGAGSRTELFQDVDVSAYADRIDTGLQRFRFEGLVRTLNEVPSDTVTLVVEYRDDAGTLEAFDSGQIASPLGWTPVSEEHLAPAGTRSIRVRLIADLFGGATNDAWVDGLSLTALRAPSIYISDERVYESPAGTTSAVFDVSLSCELDRASSVIYSTADGTAIAGEDYLSASGTVTFPAGSTRQTITVPVLGDAIHERHETFVIDLANPDPQGLVSLLDPQGEGTILNDDFCARSPGFWKTHNEVWPIRSLVMGGRLYSETQMAALLGYNGPDASNHLARQLVATRLNLEVGSTPAILPEVQAADTFLASFPPGSNPKGTDKERANAIKNKLDAYNNSGCEQVPVIP